VPFSLVDAMYGFLRFGSLALSFPEVLISVVVMLLLVHLDRADGVGVEVLITDPIVDPISMEVVFHMTL